MWKMLKSLFPVKSKNTDHVLSTSFDQQVRKAISLIENNNDTLATDEEFMNYLIYNGIRKADAIEILLFLPIAFIRKWVPILQWPDTYIEYVDKKKQTEKKYSKTKAYQVIWQVTTEYFNGNPNGDTIFKIGGRSAEFNALNPILNDNPDLKLEEIKVHKTVLIR
jgi:hypothetical protein